jgi:hypothetical protein
METISWAPTRTAERRPTIQERQRPRTPAFQPVSPPAPAPPAARGMAPRIRGPRARAAANRIGDQGRKLWTRERTSHSGWLAAGAEIFCTAFCRRVRALPIPARWVMWCEPCRRWHTHSPGEGHRAAHCISSNSAYRMAAMCCVWQAPAPAWVLADLRQARGAATRRCRDQAPRGCARPRLCCRGACCNR